MATSHQANRYPYKPDLVPISSSITDFFLPSFYSLCKRLPLHNPPDTPQTVAPIPDLHTHLTLAPGIRPTGPPHERLQGSQEC